MIIFNEKSGAGNEAWKKALAKATAGKIFEDTRKAVLKMITMSRRSRQIQQEIEAMCPKVGAAVKAEKCCREVRLGASSYKEGQIVEGWNASTDIFEKWVVVKLTKDKNNPLMKRMQ